MRLEVGGGEDKLGEGRIVTRTARRERMRGGFPLCPRGVSGREGKKNREKRGERERKRWSSGASKLKRTATGVATTPKGILLS